MSGGFHSCGHLYEAARTAELARGILGAGELFREELRAELDELIEAVAARVEKKNLTLADDWTTLQAPQDEAQRLERYLRNYFKKIADDAGNWKEIYSLMVNAADFGQLASHFERDPQSGKLTAAGMHSAMIEAMKRVEPYVAAHSQELYAILQDSLAKTYGMGAEHAAADVGPIKVADMLPAGSPLLTGAAQEMQIGKAKKTVVEFPAGKPKAPSDLMQRASTWAGQHSAKLVTFIDDTTRTELAKIVTQGIDERAGFAKTVKRIQQLMGDDAPGWRARMIAGTESSGAWNRAQWDQLKARGIKYKRIITNDPCPACIGIKAAGPVPIDEPFERPDGTGAPSKMTLDFHPPFHPNCYCSLVGAEAPEFIKKAELRALAKAKAEEEAKIKAEAEAKAKAEEEAKLKAEAEAIAKAEAEAKAAERSNQLAQQLAAKQAAPTAPAGASSPPSPVLDWTVQQKVAAFKLIHPNATDDVALIAATENFRKPEEWAAYVANWKAQGPEKWKLDQMHYLETEVELDNAAKLQAAAAPAAVQAAPALAAFPAMPAVADIHKLTGEQSVALASGPYITNEQKIQYLVDVEAYDLPDAQKMVQVGKQFLGAFELTTADGWAKYLKAYGPNTLNPAYVAWLKSVVAAASPAVPAAAASQAAAFSPIGVKLTKAEKKAFVQKVLGWKAKEADQMLAGTHYSIDLSTAEKFAHYLELQIQQGSAAYQAWEAGIKAKYAPQSVPAPAKIDVKTLPYAEAKNLALTLSYTQEQKQEYLTKFEGYSDAAAFALTNTKYKTKASWNKFLETMLPLVIGGKPFDDWMQSVVDAQAVAAAKPKKAPAKTAKANAAAPAPAQPASKPQAHFPALSEVEFVKRFASGSTGAELWRDTKTGKLYVKKTGNSAEHLREEVIADKIYEALGVEVPACRIYEIPGQRPVKLAEFVDNGKSIGEYLKGMTLEQSHAARAELRAGFAIDALLGNWDVAGAALDNILVNSSGQMIRIDNGGSLRYRAMGKAKTGAQWNGTVGELESMLDGSNAQTTEMFGDITQAEMHAGMKRILDRADDIRAAVQQVAKDSGQDLSGLLITLEKRIEFIRKRYELKPAGEGIETYNGSTGHLAPLGGVEFKQAEFGYWERTQDKKLAGEPTRPPDGKGSSGIVVLEDDGTFWIFEPTNHFSGVKNTFSKGKLEKNLTVQQNALKEAYEELGLQVELTGYLGEFTRSTSNSRMYVARRVAGHPAQAGWESAFVKRVDVATARQLLHDPADHKILDALEKLIGPAAQGQSPQKLAAAPGAAGFTAPDVVAAVAKSRSNGKTIKIDADEIEDNAAIAWGEKNVAGQDITRVKLRMTERGMERLMQRVDASLPQGTVGLAFDEDAVHSAVFNAAKTVNYHQSKGDTKYNPDKLNDAWDMVAKLKKAVDDKIISQADADHYLQLIQGIWDAVQAHTAAPNVTRKVVKVLQRPQGPSREFDIREEHFDYAIAKWDRGYKTAVKMGGATSGAGTKVYVLEIDGVRVQWKPYLGGGRSTEAYSFQGFVDIEATGPVSQGTLKKIHDALGRLGVNNAAATKGYQEALYIYKNIEYLQSKTDTKMVNDARKILLNGTLTDDERVVKLKQFVESRMNVKLPDQPSGAYQPFIDGNPFGEGRQEWHRFDMTPEDMRNKMKGYYLVHKSGTGTATLLDYFLSQGGDATSTMERIRKGVPITSGMSVSLDIQNGVSDYFFTRISSGYHTGGNQWVFDVAALARIDAINFDGDFLSGITQVYKPQVKKKSNISIQDLQAQSRGSSNETLFKHGLNLFQYLRNIMCDSPQERQGILDVFKKHKVTEIRGVPIKDVVILRNAFQP